MALDLILGAFFVLMMAMGVRRPFIWVLAYVYVDILSPQKISWGFLASVQMSLIVFVAAFGGWLITDDKRDIKFTTRQVLLVLLLAYCGYTTMHADFPEDALEKWSWVWKSIFFAIFLPLTLRTRLRVEATALVMVLTLGAITISGAIKTLLSGGGYGTLKLFVNNNTGLYESSIVSMVAIAVIPLILWLMKYGTIFKPSKFVTLFGVALIFSCCLIPVGTAARTGLVCLALLCVLALRHVKRRFLYITMIAVIGASAVPFLPAKYKERMGMIENHAADESASTRVAVWLWTLDYVKDKPMGGGFEAYRANKIKVKTTIAQTSGNTTSVETAMIEDKSRAYHSAYFEMLGEQGWPGLAMWLLLQIISVVQLERVSWRLRRSDDPQDKADRALAWALQQGHLVYLFGALFVGVAFAQFIFLLIGLQIALTIQMGRRRLPAQRSHLRRPANWPLRPLTNHHGAAPQ